MCEHGGLIEDEVVSVGDRRVKCWDIHKRLVDARILYRQDPVLACFSSSIVLERAESLECDLDSVIFLG